MSSLHIDKYIHRARMTGMAFKFTVVHNLNDSFPSVVSYTQSWFEPSGWRAKLRLSSYPAALVSLSTHVSPASWFESVWFPPNPGMPGHMVSHWAPSLKWERGFCNCSFITFFYIFYLLSFDTKFPLEKWQKTCVRKELKGKKTVIVELRIPIPRTLPISRIIFFLADT